MRVRSFCKKQTQGIKTSQLTATVSEECFLCFGKFSRKCTRIMNSTHHRQINDFLVDRYDREDDRRLYVHHVVLPCRNIHAETLKEKYVFDHSLLGNHVEYYSTRSSSSDNCECLVCDIGHSNCMQTSQLSQKKNARCRPRCLSKIGRGKVHYCLTAPYLPV